MKKYFQLYEECVLVNNSHNEGAVYNLLSGDVYRYDTLETKILVLCESKCSIDEIAETLDIENGRIVSFLDQLRSKDLGFYSEKPCYVEKMTIDYDWMKLSYLKERPNPNRAYILLSSDCDCHCAYCNSDYIRLNSCVGCFKECDNVSGNVMTYNEYICAIDRLAILGVSNLFFSGGNLFHNFDSKINIIRYAKQKNFENITVFLGSNEQICSEYLEILKDLDVNIFAQIPVIDDTSIKNNMLANSMKGILSFSVILVFEADQSIKFKKHAINECSNIFSPQNIYIDIATNVHNTSTKVREEMYNLRRTSIIDFSMSHVYNPCLNGLLTISADKSIKVCPRLSESIGSIDNFELALTSDKINKYWKLSKDQINGCKECSIRYICSDCRYAETVFSNDIRDKRVCNGISKIVYEGK